MKPKPFTSQAKEPQTVRSTLGLLVTVLLLVSIACSFPLFSSSEPSAPSPSPPAVSEPTQPDEQVPPEAPTVEPATSVIPPAAILVRVPNRTQVNLLDFQGKILDELDLSTLGYMEPFSIGGNSPDGSSLPPLIVIDDLDGWLRYFDGENLHPLPMDWTCEPVLAPGTPYMAISRTNLFEFGTRSDLFVASAAELAQVEPVFSLDSTGSDWFQITPLSIKVENSQPVGVWYTLTLIGAAGEIVFPVNHSLYYLDLAGGEPQEILGEEYRPNSISPDGEWAILTQYGGSDLFLRARSLQTGQEYSLPLDPASTAGAGYALAAPDNSKVAWMETSGSREGLEPNFTARLKLSSLDGELLHDFDGAWIAEKIGAVKIIQMMPAAWLDANTLLVEASGGEDQIEIVALLKIDAVTGAVDLFSYDAFMSMVYVGENLQVQADSQPETQPEPLVAIPDTPLSMTGPWVALPSQERLWVVNPDGSGLTPLINQASISWYVQKIAAAPQGGYLAFTAAWDNDNLQGMTLFLAKLPEMTVEMITELSSAETMPPLEPGFCDPNFEAARAGTIGNSLAWSPDGRKLAFVGVQAGSSSDVYVYSLDSGEITQLTDEPTQAYDLHWSPDGEYIVYFDARCNRAGFITLGGWVAKEDGTGAVQLYDIADHSSGERVVGWLSDSEVVVETLFYCPVNNLRKVNLESGAVTMLYEGCYYDSAMARDGTIALINADDIGLEGVGGLYIFSPSGSQVLHDPELQGYDIVYVPGLNIFFVQDTEYYLRSVDTAGVRGNSLNLLELPEFSMSGSWWASPIFNVLNVGEEGNSNGKTIFEELVYSLLWVKELSSPQEKLFFFGGKEFSAMQWYVAYSPDFEPMEVSRGMTSAGLAEPVFIYP